MKSFFTIILISCLFRFNSLAKSDQPNFIIFIADDVSWDDFACTGNMDVQTPNIDRLAENGIKFNNTYLTASSCSPSRNSILAGRYPHNTGACELHSQPPQDMLCFPAVLKEQGYFCGFSGKFHSHDFVRPAFDVISIDYKDIGNSGSDAWVDVTQNRDKDKPFFLWFAALDAHRDWGENQFSGTHNPDSITPPFYLANDKGTRQDLAQYYDEIYRFDYRIGEVLKVIEEQGDLENTMVIVMADNGRPFPHSKTRVNDRGMKTPFIINWPQKIKQKAECNSLISVIDIAPTLLTLADADIAESFQGYSFAKLIDDPSKDFRNYVFAEHNWHDFEAHERMVRNKDFMYILNSRPNTANMGPADVIGSPSHLDLTNLKSKGVLTAIQADIFVTPRPEEELYYYPNDPLQIVNVASMPEYDRQLTELRDVLKEWMEKTGDNIPANLTRDWFLKEPGYKNTRYVNERGEMPGSKKNAAKINDKGFF